jgi:hypothetical protein
VGTKSSYVWALNQQGTPLFKAVPIGQKEVRKNVTELRKALDLGLKDMKQDMFAALVCK